MSDRRRPGIHRVRIVNVRAKLEWQPRVSDHAVVRYIERVLGLGEEIAEVRRRIISATADSILHREPAATIEGHIVILQGPHVVTILERRGYEIGSNSR